MFYCLPNGQAIEYPFIIQISSMSHPIDPEYQTAKRIKQGLQTIAPRFAPLATWISETYDVSVLNIQKDFMTHNKKLRLLICVDSSADRAVFIEGEHWWGNFDATKQTQVADKYLELATKQKPVINLQFWHFFSRMPDSRDIFVAFSCFEEGALIEANERIPQEKITDLQTMFKDDRIWLISRCFHSTTLFVFTDAQKEELKNESIFESMEDYYFKLLKEYDEFNYWKEDIFKIGIDSKQNLDENYQGNWFYYYK